MSVVLAERKWRAARALFHLPRRCKALGGGVWEPRQPTTWSGLGAGVYGILKRRSAA